MSTNSLPRYWNKKFRDREVVRLHKVEGKSVQELAKIFNVSERTVQRALRDDRRS